MSIEELRLLEKIWALHEPDGREIDVKSLLQLVKLITLFADQKQDVPVRILQEFFKSLMFLDSLYISNMFYTQSPDIPKAVQSVTYHISELHKKMQDRSKGEGMHDISMSLLSVMTNFSWDAKVVLVLSSFAMNHGVWMLAQMYSASSTKLKDKDHDKLYRLLSFSQPKRLELDDAYYFYLSLIYSFSKKPKENQLPKPALTKLFQALMGVAECIIQLQELPAADLQSSVTEYDKAMSWMPVAVYDHISIVVHCAAVVSKFPSKDYEISDAEEKKLSEYAAQLNKRTKDFTDQIRECNQFLEETKVDKAYQIPIPETSHADNTEALEFLIKGGGDKGLQNLAGKLISQIKGKYVLLLVSDEESPREEISFLEKMYQAAIQLRKQQQFSILWVPLYSGLGMGTDFQFKSQLRNMSWQAVPYPSLISKVAAEFIREKWRFQSKTNILAVLDPQGTVVNINAFHMLWIWATEAFPYTRSRERALWKTQTLNMEFLLYGIKLILTRRIQEDKHIFLYGGDDIEWVRKFTTTVRKVADDMGIPIELMYVGKSSKGDQTSTSKIEAAIINENLSIVLNKEMRSWFFWGRLRSMLISKMSHQRGLESEDRTTRQLKWLLGYETEKSWAVLGKGDAEVTHGLGSTALQVLTMCDKRRISESESFIDIFRSLKKKVLESERVCCQVEFPIPSSWMPDMMRCPDPRCQLEMMDERIVFQCCHPSTSLQKKK